MSVRDLGADEASRAKVQASDGVLVDSVREGTPASIVQNPDVQKAYLGA